MLWLNIGIIRKIGRDIKVLFKKNERIALDGRRIPAFIRIELLFEIISWKAQKLRLSKKSSRIMISY